MGKSRIYWIANPAWGNSRLTLKLGENKLFITLNSWTISFLNFGGIYDVGLRNCPRERPDFKLLANLAFFSSLSRILKFVFSFPMEFEVAGN